VKDYRGDAAAAQAEAFDPTPATLDARTQISALGGLKVALLPKTTRGRVVHARLALRFGDEKSLFGQATVAGFAAGLLDKGGAGLSRQQIADQLDKLQAEVGFGSNGQALTAHITTGASTCRPSSHWWAVCCANPPSRPSRWKSCAASGLPASSASARSPMR
jgi:zinc protease